MMRKLDKEALRIELIKQLVQQRDIAINAAGSAHNDATHEQSVAETQYDTVAIEAAYLAHGQSQRVAEFNAMINQIERLNLTVFDDCDEVDIGAIIELDNDFCCWLLPVCGGYRLDENRIVVITPQSPIGNMLNELGLHDQLKDGRVISSIA
jgi:hypothetical protein